MLRQTELTVIAGDHESYKISAQRNEPNESNNMYAYLKYLAESDSKARFIIMTK